MPKLCSREEGWAVMGARAKCPAEAWASRLDGFTSYQERRQEAGELDRAVEGNRRQMIALPKVWVGFPKQELTMAGRSGERPLQSGDQLTLDVG